MRHGIGSHAKVKPQDRLDLKEKSGSP